MLPDILQMTWLTLSIGLGATLLCAPIAIVSGYVLGRSHFPGKSFLEHMVLLPMVVPPVAVGLLLLTVFGQQSPVGRFLDDAGFEVLLTWKGAVIAAAIVSAPLFIKTCEQTFLDIPRRFADVAYTLGKTPWQTFRLVTWPLAWRGIIQGALLTFARAIGEFGATSMVAGIIPGETETLALGIYSRFLNGEDQLAWSLAAVAVFVAFLAVTIAGFLAPARRGQYV